MSVTTVNPASSLYLVELQEPFETLALQFVPDEISKNRQGNFEAVLPTGRNTPVFQYTGGNDDLSLVLMFYADDAQRENVLQKVAWLESLANSDGYNAPARRIKIVFGKVFREEKWVVKTVATKLLDFAHLYGYAPMRAEVSLSLSLATDSNLTFKDIRR
jgi:hypothetical protein